MVNAANITIIRGDDNLPAAIWDVQAFVEGRGGEELIETKDQAKSFDAHKAMKRIVDRVRGMWERLKKQGIESRALTHNDWYGFEEKLFEWLAQVCSYLDVERREIAAIRKHQGSFYDGVVTSAMGRHQERRAALDEAFGNVLPRASSLEKHINQQSAAQKPDVSGKWFPYDHERMQLYLGQDPAKYKGRLSKRAKLHPEIRRNANAQDRIKFNNPQLRYVYDLLQIYEMVEERQ